MGSAENRSEQVSAKKGSFEKVGECLCRYTSNRTYYARVEKEGKEFRRSLKTTDRAVAKRKLVDLQREVGRTLPGANRITVAQWCDLYLETQQHLEKSTREDKGRIVRRMKESWPEGGNQSLDKGRPSHVEGWLSAQGSTRSASSLNSFIEVVRAVWALAVRDRLLADSPAAALPPPAGNFGSVALRELCQDGAISSADVFRGPVERRGQHLQVRQLIVRLRRLGPWHDVIDLCNLAGAWHAATGRYSQRTVLDGR